MKNIRKLLGVFVFVMTLILCVPNSVNAAADFDSLLTDGKLVINGVEPQNENEANDRFGEYFYKLGMNDYQTGTAMCDSTYTKCTIVYHLGRDDEETKDVEVVYNYDKDIKK